MDKVEEIFEELIVRQKHRLMRYAREKIPYITEEDLLQPNDFPLLELDPFFRYEEGVLEGVLSSKAAYLSNKAL